jgi:hypothetical protein
MPNAPRRTDRRRSDRRRTAVRVAAALAAALLLRAEPAAAQPTLTDVTLFNATFAGELSGTAWNTRPLDALPTVFLSPDPDAAFVAANVLNPGATLSVPLAVGSQTLYYYASSSFSNFFGLNLFFDGASTPGISAVKSFGTSLAASSAVCSVSPTGACTPASGTLSFASGGFTVTLTTYTQLADAAQNGGSVDRVGLFAVGADGTFDNHARLVIDVTRQSQTVPEPSTYGLVAVGSGLLALVARRRRRS